MRFHQPDNTPADSELISWVIEQAKKDTNSIGFFPRRKYYELAKRGRLIVLSVQGDNVAWLAHGPVNHNRQKLYQIQTVREARRCGYATRLIETTFAGLFLAGGTLHLRCRDDLVANLMWIQLGFHLTRKEEGGLRRGRLINIFERGRKIEAPGTPLTRPAALTRP